LRQRHPIAIISGRSLKDLKSRMNMPGLVYCGNHGAEMGDNVDCAGSRHFLEEFIHVAHETFSPFPGVQVEDKGLTASIHFRRVEPVLLGDFLASFQEMARKFAGRVSVTEGRKVFEIRPPGAFGKANAVRQLMEGVGKGRLPVYMGDDTSDEDAFRAVRGGGISIAVGGSREADYYLRNQGEVHEFLKLLARIPLAGGKPYRATGGRKGSQQ
jgi:trehalose-phosphatase